MALAQAEGIRGLSFNLPRRELIVVHAGTGDAVLHKLEPLNLNASVRSSEAQPGTSSPRQRSRFSVPKMDCSSEENLVRMALADVPGVGQLTFDLPKREFSVIHGGDATAFLPKLQALDLGAALVSTEPLRANEATPPATDDAAEARTLKALLAINGAMFLVEILLGIVAQSTGLIADSLDMFADAAVYGLALYAVGRAASMKVKAAHFAGWLQVALAIGALEEVVRRFFVGSDPKSGLMMGVAALALVANAVSLVIISKQRGGGAHMKASYIFSANDVIANAGVILAGALVAWTGSPYPDLFIAVVIAGVVLNGARRILRLS